MTNCFNCKFKESMPRDVHISCKNPLPLILLSHIPKSADIQYLVEKITEKTNEMNLKFVIKTTWNGCGIYPLLFDSTTILHCDNFEEKMQND